ncbi:MAG: hypothetical protein JXR19_01885 [Bacteroidia bacterium]
MNEKVEIYANKKGLVFYMIFLLLFFGMGIYMIAESIEGNFEGDFKTQGILSIVLVVVLFLLLRFLFRRYKNNDPVSILNERGIVDNPRGFTHVGLIEWVDITGVEVKSSDITKRGRRRKPKKAERILCLNTVTPEKYIDRAKNKFAKNSLNASYKIHGTPLVLSGYGKMKFEDLERLIAAYIQKYGHNND